MLETWELLSYIVTVIGLPLAILVYLFEQHKERRNDENDVYERLSRNYQDFLQLALDNPDLQLLSQKPTPNLGPEQEERMQAIFAMLIALFVLWQVRAVVSGSVQDLVDRELPHNVQEQIVAVLDAHAGQVLAYHGLRTRRAGSQKIVSLHVVLCKTITFETSHHIVDHIEQELAAAIPRSDVTIHADPCGAYCPGEPNCPWARVLR